MIPPRIKNVKALDNYCLELTYINGEKKVYDMKNNLKLEHYKKLNNIGYFKLVKSVGPTVEWPDGEDVDPNRLYEDSIDI